MTQEYYFGRAKWVGAAQRTPGTFSVLRGKFSLESVKKVSLHVLGLGFFKCYINGICVNPDTFLPLSSDYEGSCDPRDEILSGHRIYVPHFDITDFAEIGENTIAVHFGGGWYTHPERIYGLPKAIYRITAEEKGKTAEYVSDENCRIGAGYIEDYHFTQYERQNYGEHPLCFDGNFDDSQWDRATIAEPLQTEYCETDCPVDALIETLAVRRVENGMGRAVYDCGQNTTGYPVFTIRAKKGEKVQVLFSEEILENGMLDSTHAHGQEFSIISDGTVRCVQPEFTWFGFRYFAVIGAAEPQCVKVVHADIPICSTFDSDNETLNWTYKTFIHTMLCNMHTGHPSDCPHIERLGYTGDGQLTCHASLSVLDAGRFYKKWLQDIADGQDTLTGHVQYTAPYMFSGGGPGGWGCAIVMVPYQLYRHFGDTDILKKYYPNMRRYIDYLEEHSEFGLVTSDKEGDWCLGDWCGPNILYPDKDITCHNQQVILPAPMVNTYFMVKSLRTMCEIARIIGKTEDIPEYEEKAAYRSNVIRAAYFNTFDGNFIMNVQGANVYGADLGLGDERTYANIVDYYEKLGCFDTGIFATDILLRLLFEHGDGELAVRLLTESGRQGYGHWRQNGATTFHEYWDSGRSRSHNHPMFGAAVAYFFAYLLGIKQKDGTAGYTSLVIAPQTVSTLHRMAGSMKTPGGEVSVRYEKDGTSVRFNVVIPPRTEAVFRYAGEELPLSEGKNEMVFPLSGQNNTKDR